MLKFIGAIVASFFAANGAYASDSKYYSGQSFCNGEFRQAYLASNDGQNFSIYQEGTMSRFVVMNFSEPLDAKLFDSGRNNLKVEIRGISEDTLDIALVGTSCGGMFTLHRQPGMIEAYEEVQNLAKSGDTTPATAVKISDMLSNLAPS
ncbi:hypothetical protein [Celeribacter sp.]|uniref:hypothetical protein n=1 Tax=Celeribacter sp. TaxID=1890673 RepID=UPI003A92F988